MLNRGVWFGSYTPPPRPKSQISAWLSSRCYFVPKIGMVHHRRSYGLAEEPGFTVKTVGVVAYGL